MNRAADNPDLLPRRFGPYHLFDKIGEGGMARIYLGRSTTELGGERLIVVKQILPYLAGSTRFSQLLIQEAKLAARLSHGNVVQVIDLGREEDVLFIAMDYVEGFDLRELLVHCSKGRVPLPIEFALHIVIETLRALDYAHNKQDDAGRPLGIVHRDVSPSNVLLSFEGEVKLCDFGIAIAIDARDELDEETVQGKAGYMSPEAAEGVQLDARSDVFSVGIILWELLAGRRLYKSKKGEKPSLELARAAEIPPLPERGYPEEERLHGIIHRALARDRDERFASGHELMTELESYVAENNLFASPLKFGNWLTEHFGAAIVERRRARQRAAKALERGPLVELKPMLGVSAAVHEGDTKSEVEARAEPVSEVEARAEPVSEVDPVSQSKADEPSGVAEPVVESKKISKLEGVPSSKRDPGQKHDRPRREEGTRTPQGELVPSTSQQSPNAGAFVLAALVVMLLLVFWLAR